MANRGIAPLDPETQVGRFRLAYGDTQSVPLDPVEIGYGDYTELSDAEIEEFLLQSGQSVPMAISLYYGRMAGEAAKVTLSIRDHDLANDNTKRYEALLAAAEYWAGVADREDAVGGDIFEVVGPPNYRSHPLRPEAAPWPVGCDVRVF